MDSPNLFTNGGEVEVRTFDHPIEQEEALSALQAKADSCRFGRVDDQGSEYQDSVSLRCTVPFGPLSSVMPNESSRAGSAVLITGKSSRIRRTFGL